MSTYKAFDITIKYSLARFITSKSNDDVCTKIKTRESIGASEDYHIWYTGELRMVTITNPMLSHILTDQDKGNLVSKEEGEF